MWTTHFTVMGSNHFPYDMLRFDNCYPELRDDVYEMLDDSNPENVPRRVHLSRRHKYKDDKPTRTRWKSFGWAVVLVDKPFKA